ncbi:MAG: quinone-dependent dihydroorotate dehydrogenase [Micromonosporaceae bacterium]|nr:quinone-dependent dihydroorotate dehydrogenase [Micromonosporaceae bacterium]
MVAAYEWARPWLFRLGGGDAETAHEWVLRQLAQMARHPAALRALARITAVPPAPVEVFGLRFPNPVGLAAGMDKDGLALPAWPALGFGFVEVGTVTRHAQPGNDRPRMFRLRSSRAVINRMGFNNAGAAALARRLAALPRLPVPLGISLGKSRVTPVERAVEDYLVSFVDLAPYADYVAVNVSSPNTPGLRTLQDRGQLSELLGALRAEARSASVRSASVRVPATPILVKIAPDLTDHAIAELLEVCVEHEVAGVIATNTTVTRPGLAPADVVLGQQAGGLSGAPLAPRTRQVVAFVHRETGGRLPIIGVGGILDADDAVRLVDAGASLVQLYTGFVYRGPRLVREVVTALADHAGRRSAPASARAGERASGSVGGRQV